jgi:hypothetical protein
MRQEDIRCNNYFRQWSDVAILMMTPKQKAPIRTDEGLPG